MSHCSGAQLECSELIRVQVDHPFLVFVIPLMFIVLTFGFTLSVFVVVVRMLLLFGFCKDGGVTG